ncbi:MAG TPA: hypothetical protein VIU34_02025 [Steroidobacter sp.]
MLARRLDCTALLLSLALMQGCTTPPRRASEPAIAAPAVVEEPAEACAFNWKGLADSRTETGSLGRMDGQNILYPYFSQEVDRRIGDAIEIPATERRVMSVWGELMRAEVTGSTFQLEMVMTFRIHREGQTETLLNISTSVKRITLPPDERIGIRFIGPAIDESIEQFIPALQEACQR